MPNQEFKTYYYFCFAFNTNDRIMHLSKIKVQDIKASSIIAFDNNFELDLNEQWYQYFKSLKGDLMEYDIAVRSHQSREETEIIKTDLISNYENLGYTMKEHIGFDYYGNSF